MGKKHDKIVAHNLDAILEVVVVLSFKLQLNHWDVCRLVTYSGSKVKEVNFSTILWPSRAKGACENGEISIYTRKPSQSKQGGHQILIKI